MNNGDLSLCSIFRTRFDNKKTGAPDPEHSRSNTTGLPSRLFADRVRDRVGQKRDLAGTVRRFDQTTLMEAAIAGHAARHEFAALGEVFGDEPWIFVIQNQLVVRAETARTGLGRNSFAFFFRFNATWHGLILLFLRFGLVVTAIAVVAAIESPATTVITVTTVIPAAERMTVTFGFDFAKLKRIGF